MVHRRPQIRDSKGTLAERGKKEEGLQRKYKKSTIQSRKSFIPGIDPFGPFQLIFSQKSSTLFTQPTVNRCGVCISSKKGDASLDAIKGMRCRKTGEHFGGVVRSTEFLELGSQNSPLR